MQDNNETFELPIDEINKTIKINKCVSLTLDIFITIGCLLNILDNDLIRDLINSTFEFKTTTVISGFNAFFSFIVLIVTNVYYFLQ